MRILAEIVCYEKIVNKFNKRQLKVTAIDKETRKRHYLTIFENLIPQFEMLFGGASDIYIDYMEKGNFKNVVSLSDYENEYGLNDKKNILSDKIIGKMRFC